MNSSSLGIQTNEIAQYLMKLEKIVIEYGVHGISLFGAFFNTATILLLLLKMFDHKFYNFLRCRCVCNLVVCLFGVVYYGLPDIEQRTAEYIPLLLNWFLVNIPMRAALLASFISDNLLVVNRLITLCERKESVLYTLSKKVSCIIISPQNFI